MSSRISQQRISELTSKYKTITEICTVLNPTRQIAVVSDERKCFTDKYPSFLLLDHAYGNNASAQWIVPQLFNLSEFCGCKGKLNEMQLKELALMISKDYWYLKVSEFMLFCYRFKGGHYGQFYGCVDPMKIMDSLIAFTKERGKKLAHFEEEDRKEKELARPETMTYQEYCKRNLGMTEEEANAHIEAKTKLPSRGTLAVELAEKYVNCKGTMSDTDYSAMLNNFKRKFGMYPEEYIAKHSV